MKNIIYKKEIEAYVRLNFRIRKSRFNERFLDRVVEKFHDSD
ncbi:hypothetical protein LEP1GSC191_3849 [Leptospira borgpetersenii serovar Mini str. 201000851]|uniref:Uncharacterized protein n=3 Tax=Leptospira borgpetersenii TaxID=174 RepID=M3HXB7_LEPBO|nr:hypothetical protein LBBP_02958 [Leptospira borgpetersenii serovar Ballum]EKR00712.1 hypothetical protein LEP1GSC121_0679 [Leptospira borgpetersenii serovar Castellonis str. 200801910]EMG02255.1 hypothetical protein LEP1GSC123_0866 [Leptospira borgpetersenii str. 200701203]EMK08949.1 hypothetical protein LEP1GSC066_1115 [Leptospira sp. serovar Kenya str. Sh9]EMN13353.1 hypothetical protein LEP1GSC055_1120 [Leptospira borgpetersenii str. Brem 307]EMN16064.1 hypothetical protein LEP1GSC056_09